ncbi:hypothetical protein [Sporolactobacillus sp. THM19-2]|uniref:hypothetical protein n=1 Tax=Sporolactobacillus sp. THM19-2 TaxID=2511171 RepID=UPI001021A527|nr:hypothetical protein [Sporolactobacillus sp. THM19-2]RYL93267.1 hypothetical protein EWH91_05330 [Sporolactobacillus sp. THM19-2]
MAEQDPFKIPKVDLETYRFSPPGSMGWSAQDYEKLLNHSEEPDVSDPFLPPLIPQDALTELASSVEYQIELPVVRDIENTPSEVQREDIKPVDVKQKKTTGQPKQEPVRESDGHDTSEKESIYQDLILTGNPPAKPWMADQLTTFYS